MKRGAPGRLFTGSYAISKAWKMVWQSKFPEKPNPGDARWSPRGGKAGGLGRCAFAPQAPAKVGQLPGNPQGAAPWNPFAERGAGASCRPHPPIRKPVSPPRLTVARFRPVTALRGAILPRGTFGWPLDYLKKQDFDLCPSRPVPFATRQICFIEDPIKS